MTITTPTSTLPERPTPDPHLFPVLAPDQLSRAAIYEQKRPVDRGEVLVDVGNQMLRVFVVTAGELEIVRPAGEREDFVATLKPGHFSGEVSTLAGRPALVRIRAITSSEVIEIDREHHLIPYVD